jgi:hypothetical protein
VLGILILIWQPDLTSGYNYRIGHNLKRYNSFTFTPFKDYYCKSFLLMMRYDSEIVKPVSGSFYFYPKGKLESSPKLSFRFSFFPAILHKEIKDGYPIPRIGHYKVAGKSNNSIEWTNSKQSFEFMQLCRVNINFVKHTQFLKTSGESINVDLALGKKYEVIIKFDNPPPDQTDLYFISVGTSDEPLRSNMTNLVRTMRTSDTRSDIFYPERKISIDL